MTNIAKRVTDLLKKASKLSKEGIYAEAAECYLEAKQAAENDLKSNRLKYLCEHHYLLERLTSESGQNRNLIHRIVENLKNMEENLDDDRLTAEIAPMTNYFKALYLTVGEDIEVLGEKVSTLREQTDAPRDFFNSVAHILADVLHVVECIRPYRRTTDIPESEFEKRKQHLIQCIKVRRNSAAIPDPFRRILHEFESGLTTAKSSGSVERAISAFKQTISNPENQFLQLAVETMLPYIYQILNGSEKGENAVCSHEINRKVTQAVGGVFIVITFLFYILVWFLLVVFDHEMSKVAAAVLSIIGGVGVACGLGFIGGSLIAKGTITLPFFKGNKISFNAMGGIAVFIVATAIVWIVLSSAYGQ